MHWIDMAFRAGELGAISGAIYAGIRGGLHALHVRIDGLEHRVEDGLAGVHRRIDDAFRRVKL